MVLEYYRVPLNAKISQKLFEIKLTYFERKIMEKYFVRKKERLGILNKEVNMYIIFYNLYVQLVESRRSKWQENTRLLRDIKPTC